MARRRRKEDDDGDEGGGEEAVVRCVLILEAGRVPQMSKVN